MMSATVMLTETPLKQNNGMQADTLTAGFARPVANAQHAFRAVLQALSRPGLPVELDADAQGPALAPATAQILLALTDHDTPVWWSSGAQDARQATWLGFHTGAPATGEAGQAQFAVVRAEGGDQDAAPGVALSLLSAGTDEQPERSGTLLWELPDLRGGPTTIWCGPGINGQVSVRLAGLPAGFWTQWARNQASFPLGVDVLFIQGRHCIGLPRSIHVRIEEDR